MTLQHYQGSQKEDTGYFDDRYDPYSMGQFDNRVHQNNPLAKVNRDFPTLSHDFPGTSSRFSRDFHEHKRAHFSPDRYDRVKNLEHGRAELLMKLEGLKIQAGSFNYVNRNYNHMHRSSTRNIYPLNCVRNEFSSFEDSFSPCHHLGYNRNQFVSNVPRCSCFQCYTNLQIQSRVAQLANHTQIYPINRTRYNHFTSHISALHGGAPFFSCPSCFHLLNLPKIFNSAGKKKQKLRCGVCSELFSISLKKNGIIIKIHKLLKDVSTEGDVGDIEASTEDIKILDDNLKLNLRDNSSITTLESTDVGINATPRDNLEALIIPRKNSNFFDQTSKNDSPIRKGSKFAESPTPVPHSSDDVALFEEENQPIIIEDEEPCFKGLHKKSLKELLRVETGGVNVFVNGEPLSDRVVEKAEKLAGPIHPGDYWYDYCAGFWGVMGKPCHGIIPPFIEELNYPMPTNCGAGNTGVYVNGRELHESDLDLLANRGLPITDDKFYMIEISGRVVDEYTGEEIYNLGKLAPTVEKLKHGFGMRPRVIAE